MIGSKAAVQGCPCGCEEPHLADFTYVPVEDLTKVPVAYLQHAFYRMGADAFGLANNMGWIHNRNDAPDSSRALRTLGLRPMREAKGSEPAQYRETIKYKLAVEILEALHLDAMDYGL